MQSWNNPIKKKRGYEKYTRRCKRCDELYSTPKKKSKICKSCNLR